MTPPANTGCQTHLRSVPSSPTVHTCGLGQAHLLRIQAFRRFHFSLLVRAETVSESQGAHTVFTNLASAHADLQILALSFGSAHNQMRLAHLPHERCGVGRKRMLLFTEWA